jgi:hypothetical protein
MEITRIFHGIGAEVVPLEAREGEALLSMARKHCGRGARVMWWNERNFVIKPPVPVIFGAIEIVFHTK